MLLCVAWSACASVPFLCYRGSAFLLHVLLEAHLNVLQNLYTTQFVCILHNGGIHNKYLGDKLIVVVFGFF